MQTQDAGGNVSSASRLETVVVDDRSTTTPSLWRVRASLVPNPIARRDHVHYLIVWLQNNLKIQIPTSSKAASIL